MAQARLLWLSIFLAFLIPIPALAAVVTGRAYDKELKPIERVIFEITTFPKQSYVSRDGKYSFELTAGKYMLYAYYRAEDGTKYYSSKEVIVSGGGEYIVDLVLDEIFTGELPQVPEEPKRGILTRILPFAIGVGILLVLLLGVFVFRRRKPAPVLAKPQEPAMDSELDTLLSMIAKAGGRITQRELRKQLPSYSEAKISLMVSELEAKGRLEKIKKGRGNILVLKRGTS